MNKIPFNDVYEAMTTNMNDPIFYKFDQVWWMYSEREFNKCVVNVKHLFVVCYIKYVTDDRYNFTGRLLRFIKIKPHIAKYAWDINKEYVLGELKMPKIYDKIVPDLSFNKLNGFINDVRYSGKYDINKKSTFENDLVITVSNGVRVVNTKLDQSVNNLLQILNIIYNNMIDRQVPNNVIDLFRQQMKCFSLTAGLRLDENVMKTRLAELNDVVRNDAIDGYIIDQEYTEFVRHLQKCYDCMKYDPTDYSDV